MERCNPSNITFKRRKPVCNPAGLCYWEKDGAKSECRTQIRVLLKRQARNWADMPTCLAY
jgi:hypothetical protein